MCPTGYRIILFFYNKCYRSLGISLFFCLFVCVCMSFPLFCVLLSFVTRIASFLPSFSFFCPITHFESISYILPVCLFKKIYWTINNRFFLFQSLTFSRFIISNCFRWILIRYWIIYRFVARLPSPFSIPWKHLISTLYINLKEEKKSMLYFLLLRT